MATMQHTLFHSKIIHGFKVDCCQSGRDITCFLQCQLLTAVLDAFINSLKDDKLVVFSQNLGI